MVLESGDDEEERRESVQVAQYLRVIELTSVGQGDGFPLGAAGYRASDIERRSRDRVAWEDEPRWDLDLAPQFIDQRLKADDWVGTYAVTRGRTLSAKASPAMRR